MSKLTPQGGLLTSSLSTATSIKGNLPPKPQAKPPANPYRPHRTVTFDKSATIAATADQEQLLVQSYPLLRRILQSRKLLSDSVNLRADPMDQRFDVEVTNPNLKYDLLEYLVTEDSEAAALSGGAYRGGRSRPIRDVDAAFNEMSMVVLSKREDAHRHSNSTLPSEVFKDDWARLKHQSVQALGQKRIQFKSCSLHHEELVMYDKVNKTLLCCRCLAVLQLRPDCDTKEIVMADDYCLQWALKWRELAIMITQVKELLVQRAQINGLLYSQIQNYVIREALKGRFHSTEEGFKESPLLITEFAQRIFEAEQLILDYESTGAADSVHQMELAFHLYEEDLERVVSLTKNTDLLRENHIVEVIGRYMICQMEGGEKFNIHGHPEDEGAVHVVRRSHAVNQRGGESARSTMGEPGDPREVDECEEIVQRPRRPIPPVPNGIRDIQDVNKTPTQSLRRDRSYASQKEVIALKSSPDYEKRRLRLTHSSAKRPHASSTRDMRASKKGDCDDSFWEHSRDTKNLKQANSPAANMVSLLQTLSNLRIQLRQACHLAETQKRAAIESELKGDAFRALELMSETHETVVRIRGLEQRVEEVKKDIVRTQAEKQKAIAQESRNKWLSVSPPKSLTNSFKRGSSSRPYKLLKGLL